MRFLNIELREYMATVDGRSLKEAMDLIARGAEEILPLDELKQRLVVAEAFKDKSWL